MIQTVGMWGNNLAVRIPKDVPFLRKGESVELIIKKDMIQIVPVRKRRSMAELLADEDISTHPGILVDFGPDVGEEVVK